MKKGAAEGIYLVLQVIVLVMFMTVFLFILQRLPSSEPAAKINTELLRSKLNEACIKGSSELDGMAFSQVIPMRVFFTDMLPGFRIKAKGDPDFLLYYEAFPIGEGLAWEVYQYGMGERVFAPFVYSNASVGSTINSVDFEKRLFGSADSHYNKALEEALRKKPELRNQQMMLLVPNIMLSDYVNVFPTTEPEPIVQFGQQEHKKGDAGEWLAKGDSSTSENVYRIELQFAQDKKSFIKYRPCGVNSLCLKTAENVYRIPLGSSCRDISNIHLEYDNTATRVPEQLAISLGSTVGVGAASVIGVKIAGGLLPFLKWTGGLISWLGTLNRGALFLGVGGSSALNAERYVAGYLIGLYFSRKDSDFYLASPCKFQQNIKIEKKSCRLMCDKWIKYPVYSVFVDKNNIKNVKVESFHYQCIDGLGPADLDMVKNIPSADPPDGECLNVKVEELPEFFCWTRNPFRHSGLEIKQTGSSPVVRVDFLNAVRNTVSHQMGLSTVVDNTEYIAPNMIYVKQIANPFTISFAKELLNTDWKWPG